MTAERSAAPSAPFRPDWRVRAESGLSVAAGLSIADRRIHRSITAAWAVPVLLTVTGASDATIVWTAWAAALFCSIAILLRPKAVLVGFPFFALIGPLGGFVPILGISYVLSDWLFALLACQLAVVSMAQRSHPVRALQAILFASFFVSAVAAIASGAIGSVKPVLYLLQLTVVYLYTQRYAHSARDWNLVLSSWVAATLLGAVLLLHAYSLGVPLIAFSSRTDSAPPATRDESMLFQATYYYAGFHFAIGVSSVILALHALRTKGGLAVVMAAFGVVFLSMAAFLMGNKTALYGSLISTAGLASLLAARRPGSKAARRWLLGAVGVAAVFWVVSVLDDVGQVQVRMLRGSLTSVSSLIIRTEVWESALRSWVAQPLHMLIGLGPDFFDLADPKLSAAFKVSSVTGLVEGTVDSGWIAYLLELGIVAYGIVLALMFKSARALWKTIVDSERLRFSQPVALYVFGGMCYVWLALITQSLGYSKISWLALQLLTIGLQHDRTRAAWRREHAVVRSS